MNKKPFFSVIVCTFNRQKTLLRALRSLEKQTFKDYECIVVDDGSTDNTKVLLQKYNWVKYLHQKNKGVGVARNLGVSKSEARYITFLDSDDEYQSNHLQTRFNYIKKYPKVDFFYNGYKIIGNTYVPDKDDNTKLVNLRDCVHGPTFVFKRKVFKKIGGFKPLRFAEDPDFYERARKHRFKFFEIKNKTYVYYHNNPNSLTVQTYKKALGSK